MNRLHHKTFSQLERKSIRPIKMPNHKSVSLTNLTMKTKRLNKIIINKFSIKFTIIIVLALCNYTANPKIRNVT